MPSDVTDRSERAAAKFESRRATLAASALQTLAEHGYARTSLRDIAQASDFSHGVLHYYFADKLELISYCVRQYKADCVHRYDVVLATATTAEELQSGFLDLLGQTLVEDAAMHRLWYDLRAQSLFEERLRLDAEEIDSTLEQMVWRILSRFCELAGLTPAVSPGIAYATVDGLFQRELLGVLAGDRSAADRLRTQVAEALGCLLG